MNNFKDIYKKIEKENKDLIKKFSKIKLICLDFDGTFTDNTTAQGVNKEGLAIETITRSKTDSIAIDLLRDAGLYNKNDYQSLNHSVDIIFLSREVSNIIKVNADKVKIKCVSSLREKEKALEEEISKRGLNQDEVLFIGNDYNDLKCIKYAGIGVSVGDGVDYVKKAADYITEHLGGRGAFREIVELILYAQEKHLCNK